MDNEEINISYDKLEALYLNKETYSFPKVKGKDKDKYKEKDNDKDQDQDKNTDIEIFEGKLGLISYFQEKVYEKSSYKLEPKPKIINENGEEESKPIPLERFIRFKLDNKKLKSNAKLVEWSDGTMSLFIGDKYYNISTQNLMNSRIGIKVNDDLSLIGLDIPKRMTASLTEKDAINVKKFTEDVTSKVKISYTIKGDNDYLKSKYLQRKRKKF